MKSSGVSISVIITAILLFCGTSCVKIDEYPIEPKIEYESFGKIFNPYLGAYDRGIFKISFTDGDGDIGLSSSDTEHPYKYNFYITYYEIQNGDTVQVIFTWDNNVTDTIPPDTLTHNARIPYLLREGVSKSIKGEIEDTLQIYNFNSGYDTIMFEAYIVDRALHKSNTVTTPLIIRK
ncbi:MAG: hypothetical protein K8R53_02030 [Bacteroidales bacterium]|nr:hypothetical protein [Bacteroidales bacterium]